MKNRRTMQIAGIVFTAFAFASFASMDSFAGYSTLQDALNYSGYAFCAVALLAFYKAIQSPA